MTLSYPCVSRVPPKVFKFPQWNAASSMCWVCAAGNEQNSWKDFSAGAGWRGTERTHRQYLEHAAAIEARGGPSLSNLFMIEGFVLESIVIDAMHCLDLGVTQHVIGNVLYEIVKCGAYGRTIKLSLERLWAKLTTWYKEEHPSATRIPSLSWEDITDA